MSVFLLKRLITLVATLVATSIVVFVVLEVLPGNAAQILMGPDASPEAVQALAAKLGIDRPPVERYGHWVAGLRALLLPAVSLAVVQAAILARITRSAVLDVLREDFVRTARAKGLSERATLWGHVLRNAMIPVVTVMGLQFAELLAGTIVVESVFYLPGLGRLIFQSISNRHLIVVRNCVMLLAAMVVVVNFMVDVRYARLDPPVKGR